MESRAKSLWTFAALVTGAWWFGFHADPRPHSDGAPPGPRPEVLGDVYADDLRHLTSLLRDEWSWLGMREEQGLDLQALEADALAICRNEPGDRGFLRALRRYVSGLSDGHGHVHLEGIELNEERQWPISLIEVEEGIMVDGIGPAIFRSKALTRGDIILEVDSEPIDNVLREQERFLFASTPGARRRKAIFELTKWTDKKTLRIKALRMGDAEPVTVELPCLAHTEPVPRRGWRHFPNKYEDLDDKTAYFCVGSFSPNDPDFVAADPEARHRILAEQYEGYARVFESIGSKEDLILDLRGNGGGTDLLGQALALHLMEPGFHYFRLAAKLDGEWHHTPWMDPVVGNGAPRFRGRVFCLIDENSFSVTDNFASCLRDEHPNVVFIGQPTGGGSGAPRMFALPATNAKVRFCTMRVFAPNDTYVEGNGVQPDVLVRPSRAQMLAGDDAVLDAALARLRD